MTNITRLKFGHAHLHNDPPKQKPWLSYNGWTKVIFALLILGSACAGALFVSVLPYLVK